MEVPGARPSCQFVFRAPPSAGSTGLRLPQRVSCSSEANAADACCFERAASQATDFFVRGRESSTDKCMTEFIVSLQEERVRALGFLACSGQLVVRKPMKRCHVLKLHPWPCRIMHTGISKHGVSKQEGACLWCPFFFFGGGVRGGGGVAFLPCEGFIYWRWWVGFYV